MSDSHAAQTDSATVELDAKSLTFADAVRVMRDGAQVTLAPEAIEQVRKGEHLVAKIISENRIVYGVTTGFGALSSTFIPAEKVKQLQINLIKSHAVGVGDPFPVEVVRGMILIKANSMASGNSGIRLQTLQTLIEMLNKGVTPYVPEKGSVGASGDLAPTAHIGLVLIGEGGKAYYQGELLPGAEAMKRAGIEPAQLEAKEGLALTNGTQSMNALAILNTYDAEILMKSADIVAALSLEALQGLEAAFDARIHELRPHAGQKRVAANFRHLLAGRDNSDPERVQDAYCLRCIPQVHGASRDALDYVRQVVETENNAVTDNPLLFPETEESLSGGNFHGQPLALAMDFLGIALSEIADISERRIDRLLHPSLRKHLPAFLVEDSGVNSGFMITQYTAASLVSENKVLAHPASVDSIPTCGSQEDHVSMGMNAARKAVQILKNVQNVLAIEALCAAQAIDFLQDAKLGTGSKLAFESIRTKVPFVKQDSILSEHIEMLSKMISTGELLNRVEGEIGNLR